MEWGDSFFDAPIDQTLQAVRNAHSKWARCNDIPISLPVVAESWIDIIKRSDFYILAFVVALVAFCLWVKQVRNRNKDPQVKVAQIKDMGSQNQHDQDNLFAEISLEAVPAIVENKLIVSHIV
jgi:hypothetical protein